MNTDMAVIHPGYEKAQFQLLFSCVQGACEDYESQAKKKLKNDFGKYLFCVSSIFQKLCFSSPRTACTMGIKKEHAKSPIAFENLDMSH